uniref:CD99 antigen-like n=1 Tax=Pristiophorus japonicus TaxID=55135 RepID=UPI00398EBD2F
MLSSRTILLIGLAFVFVATKGEDYFDLGDALKDDPTNAPAVKPTLPDFDTNLDFDDHNVPSIPKNRNNDPDGFNLDDAINGKDKYTPTKPSRPANVPNAGGSGRQFADSDLEDGLPVKPNVDDAAGGEGGGNSTITGIVTGLLLALGGGVSSYVLYQKKKLCFGMGNSSEQPAKQDNVAGKREDPQSYSTLLQSQPAGTN